MTDQHDPSRARYEFKRKLEEIQSMEGRGTELISLYIPPDKQISDVTSYLRNEISQASNIKSKSTRKNVQAAIESILSRLRNLRFPPENGMVLFVGHVSKSGDQTQMRQFVIEPPEPLRTYIYRCDSSFHLEHLEDMLVDKKSYGLIVIDRSEFTVGLLQGKKITPVKNVQSLVPSKHGRGGQSARRFERLIEIAAHDYFKKVGDIASEVFLGEEELQGVLVGGPGATKDYFVEKAFLHHEIKKKVVDTFDTGYTDEYGLTELVEQATQTLEHLELMHEKKLMKRLMKEIVKPSGGLSAYGEAEVREKLMMGAVEMLLLSDALRLYRVDVKCGSCGYGKEFTTRSKGETVVGHCPECGSPSVEASSEDIVEELSNLADSTGASVEIISADSPEGETLSSAFGGIAAVLRFSS